MTNGALSSGYTCEAIAAQAVIMPKLLDHMTKLAVTNTTIEDTDVTQAQYGALRDTICLLQCISVIEPPPSDFALFPDEYVSRVFVIDKSLRVYLTNYFTAIAIDGVGGYYLARAPDQYSKMSSAECDSIKELNNIQMPGELEYIDEIVEYLLHVSYVFLKN